MTFRLKGEAEDEIRDEPLPGAPDVISAEDAFPEGTDADEGEAEIDEDEPAGLLSAMPGPLIAAGTFVPTFLAVFFGLSSLIGAIGPTGPSATPGSTALGSDLSGQPGPTPSEALRDPLDAARGADSAPASPPSNPGPASEETVAPTIEATRPSLPPAQPQAAPAPEPRVTRSPEPPRQPQAAVLNAPERAPTPAPAVETRKGGHDWTPAAAFADREAATRLANSIQQQGYPVEIRQDPSATRPWVVWIGGQPRGGDRRR